MFDRLRHILSRPAVLVLLFSLSLTLFCWPMLSAVAGGPLSQAHFTLFSIWFLLVLALWVITRAIESTEPKTADSSNPNREQIKTHV